MKHLLTLAALFAMALPASAGVHVQVGVVTVRTGHHARVRVIVPYPIVPAGPTVVIVPELIGPQWPVIVLPAPPPGIQVIVTPGR